jgi:DME family drug/metabolite transporter
MSSTSETRLGFLYIALAAALWGTLGIASRLVLQAGLDPLEVSFWRASLGGACFAAHAIGRRRVQVERGDLAAIAAFAAGGVSLFYFSYQNAVRDGGAALAAILLYTAHAWVAIASALWLHESLTPRKLAALAVTLLGVGLVAIGTSGAAGALHVRPSALGWGLLAGLSYSTYYLFGKRYFSRYEPTTLFMYALPLGALLLLPAVRFAPKSAATWGWLAFVAFVPTYLALLVYGAGLRRVAATHAVTIATLEPVVAALLAYAVFGETLGPLGYVGAALVLAGVLATSRQS